MIDLIAIAINSTSPSASPSEPENGKIPNFQHVMCLIIMDNDNM